MYKMYKTYAYYSITKAVADGVRSNTAPIYIYAHLYGVCYHHPRAACDIFIGGRKIERKIYL